MPVSHRTLRNLNRQVADVEDLADWLDAQGIDARALCRWADRYAMRTAAVEQDEIAEAAMVGFEVGFRACLRQQEEALGL